METINARFIMIAIVLVDLCLHLFKDFLDTGITSFDCRLWPRDAVSSYKRTDQAALKVKQCRNSRRRSIGGNMVYGRHTRRRSIWTLDGIGLNSSWWRSRGIDGEECISTMYARNSLEATRSLQERDARIEERERERATMLKGKYVVISVC